eukprot:1458913-Rhodomonas_salina.1
MWRESVMFWPRSINHDQSRQNSQRGREEETITSDEWDGVDRMEESLEDDETVLAQRDFVLMDMSLGQVELIADPHFQLSHPLSVPPLCSLRESPPAFQHIE